MTLVQRLAAFSFAFVVPCLAVSSLGAAEMAVGCQGRVIPQSRIIRLAAPADQGTPIIQNLQVEEGDLVEANGVVAVLMAEGPATFLREQAIRKLEAAKAGQDSLVQAEKQALAEIALQKIDAQNSLAIAEASLAALKVQATRRRLSDEGVKEIQAQIDAKTAVLEMLKANRPAYVEQLDANVRSAQVQADEASGSRGRIANAALNEVRTAREVSLREYDAKITGAAGEIDVLKAQLAQGSVLNRQTEREPAEAVAAEQQVLLAKERLAAVQAYADTTRARYAADGMEATASIAEAESGVRLADNRLALTHIRAPFKGSVLRVFARPGEAVGPNGVIEMADLSKMAVEAEVSVADLARVKVGGSAVIRVPGLDKDFHGKVTRIGLRAGPGALMDENPAAFKDLRVMPVFIVLDDPASLSGYTGTQVTVRITNE
ncbi:MAG: efflux RND transporter periplasmic adaptor subunit [Puniceicoccales bacterium]|jgi:HlyD family secretion protein|nr:efflux RND transporter periplasmic adaptor subunit [Puniceicoccales bacterium]